MKPPPFDYHLPETIEEVLDSLQVYGEEAQVLAGGQTLVPMLNMRLLEPKVLIDISGLCSLNFIRQEDHHVVVGAATTQSALEEWPNLFQTLPLVSQAIPWVGHFQIRNRGTVCGSIALADPSAELPLCLCLLEGEVVLRSQEKQRTLPAKDFFTGPMMTNREETELIEAVRFPISPSKTRYAFQEVSMRHGDFAIVAVGVAVTKKEIRMTVGGMGDFPKTQSWPRLEGEALEDALNDFAWGLQGYDDLHASARYRRELVRRIGKKCILEAVSEKI